MKIIDGKKIALAIKQMVRQEISKLPVKLGLAVILVGQDPASKVYVDLKEMAAWEVGLGFKKYKFKDTSLDLEIIGQINKLNKDPKVHGILVQLPLPRGLDTNKIISAIDYRKDVDGFHSKNVKLLLSGLPCIVPGLADGIMRLIQSTNEPLNGKTGIILANSQVFGEPLNYLLKKQGVKVSSCYPESPNCHQLTQTADILVVAVGRPNFIKESMIKPGAIVIDVGYNRIDNRQVGDVDFESVKHKAGWLSPVPGGVGPMTVVMLLNNVVKAYELQKSSPLL